MESHILVLSPQVQAFFRRHLPTRLVQFHRRRKGIRKLIYIHYSVTIDLTIILINNSWNQDFELVDFLIKISSTLRHGS